MSFFSDAYELDITCIHVFDDDGSIGLVFELAAGSIHVRVPVKLARQLADGLQGLVHHEISEA